LTLRVSGVRVQHLVDTSETVHTARSAGQSLLCLISLRRVIASAYNGSRQKVIVGFQDSSYQQGRLSKTGPITVATVTPIVSPSSQVLVSRVPSSFRATKNSQSYAILDPDN
jgi:hypothetical protein